MEPKITESEIGILVDRFYDKVRRDSDIGPIFNAIVGDWPHHLATPRSSGLPSSSPPGATKATP
jgi:hypothetical protein